MALPPTIIKLFIKLPVLFLIEIEKKIFNYMWKHKRARIVQTILTVKEVLEVPLSQIPSYVTEL